MQFSRLWTIAAIAACVALAGCETAGDGNTATTDSAEKSDAAQTETVTDQSAETTEVSTNSYAPDGTEGATVTVKPVGKALISIVSGHPVRIHEGASKGAYRQAQLKPGDYVLNIGTVDSEQGLNLEFHGEPGEYYVKALAYVVDGQRFWTPVIVRGSPEGPIVADKDGLLIGKSQADAAALLSGASDKNVAAQGADSQPPGADAADSSQDTMTKEEATARVKAQFEAGLKAFQAERYGEALESLNDALAIAPKFDSALVLRGVVLARLKKPKVALESLDEGIAVARENRGPDSDWLNWPYLEKGLILISMRQFKPGYEALSESIRVKPTPKALIARANMDFARGRALGDKGNWDAAEPHFRHAQADADKGIEMAPQSAPLWSIKAGTHIMLNEHEQACSAMRKACEFGNCSILEQNPQCKPGGS